MYDCSIKKVYIDRLDDIVDQWNDIYHRTIEMKPLDAKKSENIDSGRENNDKDPNLILGDWSCQNMKR